MSDLLDIVALRPADTPEYMTPAWLGCVRWAASEPEVVDAFLRETGIQWSPASTPLERLIDQATGSDKELVSAFVRWANENVWGPL